MSETKTCPHCKVEFEADDLGDRPDCPVCGLPLGQASQEQRRRPRLWPASGGDGSRRLSETKTCPHCKVEFDADDLGDRPDCPVCGLPLDKSPEEHAQDWTRPPLEDQFPQNDYRDSIFDMWALNLVFCLIDFRLKSYLSYMPRFLDGIPLPANFSRWGKPLFILMLLVVSGGLGAWLAMAPVTTAPTTLEEQCADWRNQVEQIHREYLEEITSLESDWPNKYKPRWVRDKIWRVTSLCRTKEILLDDKLLACPDRFRQGLPDWP